MYFFLDLEASMPSSLRFLLFRIHLIGMTMSKDVSFNSNNFSSNYFSRSFTFWSILIILIQFQIIVNKWIKVLVSWWSAYFLIFWLADFEYPALLIGLELLLRSLSLSTPLWPSWDLSGSAYWIEFFPTNQSSSNKTAAH